MREFFSTFKTTNPGQPFCGPANFLQRQVMNHSSNPSLIPGQAGCGGREAVLCSQLRGWAGLGLGPGRAAVRAGSVPSDSDSPGVSLVCHQKYPDWRGSDL